MASLKKGMDPTAREYPATPRLAVGAVIWRDGRVLLARRGHQPNLGMWSLPGGMVEVGETLREAVLREVREECDLDIALLDVVEVVDLIRHDEAGRVRTHYVVVDFAALHRSGEAHAASDISEARWVSPASLADYGVSEAVQRVVEASRAQVAGLPPSPSWGRGRGNGGSGAAAGA